MAEKSSGEVWAELANTEPIPLWDVENGRFIADMDYAEPEPVPEPDLNIRERLIARALQAFNR